MYAENNTDTKLLFNGDPKQLLVESTDNVELFKFNNLKDRFENLYLIVNISNKEESIKLTAIKDFENKSLFKILFSKTNETYVDNNIKLKLSDKFIYDKETGKLNLNPNSLQEYDSFIEPNFGKVGELESYQFVRHGYFYLDSKLSTENKMVFNRIVPLKSSFKLPQK